MGNGRFGPIQRNEKENQRQKKEKKISVDYNRMITFIMVAVIVVLCAVMYKDWKSKKEADMQLFVQVSQPTPAAQNMQTNMPVATVSPEMLRPQPEVEGQLPVFNRANTDEKRIAITINGIGSAKNFSTLMGLCATYNAKVTLFPTADEVSQNMGAWGEAVLGGHQIENHTYNGVSFAGMSREEMTMQIEAQTTILRNAIGDDYSPHFLRPDDMADDLNGELHALLRDAGYYGIARWRVHTPGSLADVEPGAVLAYTLNDAGLRALSAAVPVLSENGYEMVTMNELFLYPDNFPANQNAG